MAYWSIILLIVPASFLAYRHLPEALNHLPPWFRPEKQHRDSRAEHVEFARGQTQVLEDDIAPESKVEIEVIAPSEEVKTPKGSTSEPGAAVPSFSFDQIATDGQDVSPQSRPSQKSSVSQQEPLSAPCASNGTRNIPKTSSMGNMPPPPRPLLAPPPSSAASLRVPTTGPLPNRGPPANSQQRVNGGLSPNGAASAPKSRGKVLLSPGHSPLDWAVLTRSSNLSGVSTVQRVTPSMLKSMTGRKGKPAWTSWQGKVYNITPYLPFHPGGEAELMRAAGRDGTQLFLEIHPWVNWENMLNTCMVGVMVPESHGMGCGSSLEDMD